MYVYVQAYVYTHMYMHVCTYIHASVYIHACIHTYARHTGEWQAAAVALLDLPELSQEVVENVHYSQRAERWARVES